MSELTFSEVITRIKRGETYECTDDSFVIAKIYKSKSGCIEFEWHGDYKTYSINPDARFKLKQINKPVTFSEAMASMKKVRFDRRIDEDVESEDFMLDTCLNWYLEGKYLSLSDIMLVLGWMYTPCEIREIMAGNWYIED